MLGQVVGVTFSSTTVIIHSLELRFPVIWALKSFPSSASRMALGCWAAFRSKANMPRI